MSKKCRYTGFKKPCLEHGCEHYVQLLGTDPQTGESGGPWMCSDLAMIKVALEGNKEIREHGATTQAFRSEMVLANVRAFDMMTQLPPSLPPSGLLDCDT